VRAAHSKTKSQVRAFAGHCIHVIPPLSASATPAPLAADDLTLLRCFQRTRDEAAFAELLRRHWPMVLGVCRRRLSPDALAEAEDVAQTVFLLLARKAFWFRREVVLAGWLHRAALHTCRTMQRARLRQLHRDTEAARRVGLENSPASPADSALSALPSELARQLDDALDALPARLRAAVVLCHLQGRSRREAGVLLGCGENTVSKRLERALPRLRVILEKRGVALTAPALLAALGHTATEAEAATVPSALLIAAAKSQLGPLGGMAAGLAALSAWWPAPAALVLIAVGSSGYLAVRERSAAPSPIGAADVAPFETVSPAPRPEPIPPVASLDPSPAASTASVLSAARLEKLRRVTPETYQKFIDELILSKATPAEVVARLEDRLGLALTEAEARDLMANSKMLLLGTLDVLGQRHPHDTLAWIAGMSELDATHLGFVSNAILARETALDLPALAALLPSGPGAETILASLRLRQDAPGEASRRLAGITDEQVRRQRLHALSSAWPQARVADAFSWAAQNLQGPELGQFLAGVSYELSHREPETTLLLLEGLRGGDALAPVLQRTLRGLIEVNGRIAEVLPLIESLSGNARAETIEQLANRWVRKDEEGLIEWLSTRQDPADLRAALPSTLPQLAPENRVLFLDRLFASDAPATEAALIRAATPKLIGATREAAALIERLATRPGLSELSAGAKDNGQLLWRAVETTARNWVSRDSGAPKDAAAWVDRLRFATPADKAKIARIVYDQWKASDEPAATAWARANGAVPAVQ
jgi:RNA polymerase sigma factor (sigma-70 family)